MKLLEETDTVSRIGEAIGKLISIFIVGMLAWIVLKTVLHL
jgi:hypothetical protein